MPNKCAVIGCKSFIDGRPKPPNVTSHKFPKSMTMRKAWLRMLGRIDFVPSSHSVICSLHFRPKDIQRRSINPLLNSRKLQRIYLKKTAIPCFGMGVSLEDVLPKPPEIQKRRQLEIRRQGTPKRAVSDSRTTLKESVVRREVMLTRPPETIKTNDGAKQNMMPRAERRLEPDTKALDSDDDVVVLEVIRHEPKTITKQSDAKAATETPSPKACVLASDGAQAVQLSGSQPAQPVQKQSAPVIRSDDFRKFGSMAETVMKGLKSGQLLPSAAADSVIWLQTIRAKCGKECQEEIDGDSSGAHMMIRLNQLNQMDKKIAMLKSVIEKINVIPK